MLFHGPFVGAPTCPIPHPHLPSLPHLGDFAVCLPRQGVNSAAGSPQRQGGQHNSRRRRRRRRASTGCCSWLALVRDRVQPTRRGSAAVCQRSEGLPIVGIVIHQEPCSLQPRQSFKAEYLPKLLGDVPDLEWSQREALRLPKTPVNFVNDPPSIIFRHRPQSIALSQKDSITSPLPPLPASTPDQRRQLITVI